MKTRRLGGAKSDDSDKKSQSKSKSRPKERRCKRSNNKNRKSRKSSAKSVSVSIKNCELVSRQLAESESDRLVSESTSSERVGESRWSGDPKCGSSDEVVSSTSDPGQPAKYIYLGFTKISVEPLECFQLCCKIFAPFPIPVNILIDLLLDIEASASMCWLFLVLLQILQTTFGHMKQCLTLFAENCVAKLELIFLASNLKKFAEYASLLKTVPANLRHLSTCSS